MATAQQKAAEGVVVGMKALTGVTKERLDIDDLIQNKPDTFNLFLLALSKLQDDPGRIGFYGLAGIHGLPTDTWDGVNRIIQDTFGGYCAHGVLTFPTWHRPYLALFEQSIYLKMVEIAEKDFEAPYKQKYLDAAKEFRLPYYDYSRPRGGPVSFKGVVKNDEETDFPYNFQLPGVFNDPKVTVKQPPNEKVNHDFTNPLYQYKFTEQQQKQLNLTTYPRGQTVRYPANSSSTTHNLDIESLRLNQGREGRTSYSLDLLNTAPYKIAYNFLSNRVIQPGDLTAANVTVTDVQKRASGSVEGLHNTMHGAIGGRGQMGDPQVSAFDPVFWFHHCNIDRLFALWQAMHPDVWFPQPLDKSKKGDNKRELYPFYKSRTSPGKGEFYDSDDAIKTEAFGYVYDDFRDLSPKDTTALWKRIQDKYNWSFRHPQHPNFGTPPANMKFLDFSKTRFYYKAKDEVQTFSRMVASNVAAFSETVGSGAQAVLSSVSSKVTKIDPKFDREWYIDSTVKRSAANGVFTIYFFLAPPGQLSNDPEQFATSPYLAALNHIFAAPRETCDNCGRQDEAGQLLSDTAPITPLLLDYLDRTDNHLDSLRPEHVEAFLVKYLRWRVVFRVDGIRDPRQVPDLKVSISAKKYSDDGSVSYEQYPQIVAQILANASASAGS